MGRGCGQGVARAWRRGEQKRVQQWRDATSRRDWRGTEVKRGVRARVITRLALLPQSFPTAGCPECPKGRNAQPYEQHLPACDQHLPEGGLADHGNQCRQHSVVVCTIAAWGL